MPNFRELDTQPDEMGHREKAVHHHPRKMGDCILRHRLRGAVVVGNADEVLGHHVLLLVGACTLELFEGLLLPMGGATPAGIPRGRFDVEAVLVLNQVDV